MHVEYFDLLEVDVTYSTDKKSFDARAVLRSTYHTAFLERGLATLPEHAPAPADALAPVAAPAPAARARRAAGVPPAAAAQAPAAAEPIKATLQNSNLLVGPGDSQIYPSRLVSRSLDGASVNMGEHAGVVALLKKEVPHVIGVHGVAHLFELAWLAAVKDQPLIQEMLEINTEAYNWWAGSGKKRLSFGACCSVLGEEALDLIAMHGIRWREASWRASLNLIRTWRARCTDLLETARTEVGMTLGPLSAPEMFLKKTFRKKTQDAHGVNKIFTIKVSTYCGVMGGFEMFNCVYVQTKETEKFSKGDILGYILADSEHKDTLYATSAGQLLEKLTRYRYVKTLHFWTDLSSEGKVLSKILQQTGVLISDVTGGVEDCCSAVKKLSSSSEGPWMKAFTKDFDSVEARLDGIELSGIDAGETAYKDMRPSVCSDVVDDVNERFVTLLKSKVLKAACIFEHSRWPSYETAWLG